MSEAVAIHGKIKAKAFPARAAILLKMLNVDETIVEAVYEKPGSKKIGHYVPGTRIPIKSDSDLDISSIGKAPVLNLAWHISSEIKSYMKTLGYEGLLIDVISDTDFDSN